MIVDYISIFFFTIALGYFIQKYLKKQQLAALATSVPTGSPSTSAAAKSDITIPSVDGKASGVSSRGSRETNTIKSKSAVEDVASSCGCGAPQTSCRKTTKSVVKSATDDAVPFSKIKIYYGSETGTAKVRNGGKNCVSFTQHVLFFLLV